MTPRIVPGWNPLGARPASTDDELFELLTAAVFQARFRPDVVQARWPAIRRAFADFHLGTVAGWSDEKAEELLASPGMIRSPKKIRATLRNARELQGLVLQHGSARAWLRSIGDDPEAIVRAVDEWAHYVGAPSIRWFVANLEGSRPAGARSK